MHRIDDSYCSTMLIYSISSILRKLGLDLPDLPFLLCCDAIRDAIRQVLSGPQKHHSLWKALDEYHLEAADLYQLPQVQPLHHGWYKNGFLVNP